MIILCNTVSLFVGLLGTCGVLSPSKVAQHSSGWPWHDFCYRTDYHLSYLDQKRVGF